MVRLFSLLLGIFLIACGPSRRAHESGDDSSTDGVFNIDRMFGMSRTPRTLPSKHTGKGIRIILAERLRPGSNRISTSSDRHDRYLGSKIYPSVDSSLMRYADGTYESNFANYYTRLTADGTSSTYTLTSPLVDEENMTVTVSSTTVTYATEHVWTCTGVTTAAAWRLTQGCSANDTITFCAPSCCIGSGCSTITQCAGGFTCDDPDVNADTPGNCRPSNTNSIVAVFQAVGDGSTIPTLDLGASNVDSQDIRIFKNGVLQTVTTDYTFQNNSGATPDRIIFVAAPAALATVTASYGALQAGPPMHATNMLGILRNDVTTGTVPVSAVPPGFAPDATILFANRQAFGVLANDQTDQYSDLTWAWDSARNPVGDEARVVSQSWHLDAEQCSSGASERDRRIDIDSVTNRRLYVMAAGNAFYRAGNCQPGDDPLITNSVTPPQVDPDETCISECAGDGLTIDQEYVNHKALSALVVGGTYWDGAIVDGTHGTDVCGPSALLQTGDDWSSVWRNGAATGETPHLTGLAHCSGDGYKDTGFSRFGTSGVAPQLAGVAAGLMEAYSYLEQQPETMRAILMASPNEENGPDGCPFGRSGASCATADGRDGTGLWDWVNAEAMAANPVNPYNTATTAGHDSIDATSGPLFFSSTWATHRYRVSCTAGHVLRAVLAWAPSAGYNADGTTYSVVDPDLDLDLFTDVGGPGVLVARSRALGQPYEHIQYTSPSTRTYWLLIRKRASPSNHYRTYAGIAWTCAANGSIPLSEGDPSL